MVTSASEERRFRIEKRIDLGHLLTIITIIIVATIFVIRIESDVSEIRKDVEILNERQIEHIRNYEEFRFMVIPDTYLRQDVGEEQLNTIKTQLDRIEQQVSQ